MRFSLKWILVATVYAAVAAAALSQETWVYADLLWAAALVAFASALLLAIFARGERQIAAAGFVVFSLCFLGCLNFGNAVPTTRVLLAAGIGLEDAPPLPTPSFPTQRMRTIRRPIVEAERRPDGTTFQRTRYITETVAVPTPPIAMGSAASGMPVYSAPQAAPPQPLSAYMAAAYAPSPVDFGTYVRAGNAIAAMVFGLLGCLVGSLVFRRCAPLPARVNVVS